MIRRFISNICKSIYWITLLLVFNQFLSNANINPQISALNLLSTSKNKKWTQKKIKTKSKIPRYTKKDSRALSTRNRRIIRKVIIKAVHQTQKSRAPICEFQRNTTTCSLATIQIQGSTRKRERERERANPMFDPKVDGFFAGWAGLQLASSASNARYLPITPWRELRSPQGWPGFARRRKPQQWTPGWKFSLVCNNRSQNLSRGCFPRSTLCQKQLRVYSTLRCALSDVWVLLAVEELEGLYQCGGESWDLNSRLKFLSMDAILFNSN